MKGKSESVITERRATMQLIQTSEASTSDAAASKIVDTAKKATPTAMEIKGVLPNVNIGRTTGGTMSRVRWVDWRCGTLFFGAGLGTDSEFGDNSWRMFLTAPMMYPCDEDKGWCCISWMNVSTLSNLSLRSSIWELWITKFPPSILTTWVLEKSPVVYDPSASCFILLLSSSFRRCSACRLSQSTWIYHLRTTFKSALSRVIWWSKSDLFLLLLWRRIEWMAPINVPATSKTSPRKAKRLAALCRAECGSAIVKTITCAWTPAIKAAYSIFHQNSFGHVLITYHHHESIDRFNSRFIHVYLLLKPTGPFFNTGSKILCIHARNRI